MTSLSEVLFPDDQKKILDAVVHYPLGSHQIGEIAKLSALLYARGIDVVKHLELLHERY